MWKQLFSAYTYFYHVATWRNFQKNLQRFNEPPAYFEFERDRVFEPWRFLEKDEALRITKLLHRRYPGRYFLVFAKNESSNQVSSWDLESRGFIQNIREYAPHGYERGERFDCFESWQDTAKMDHYEWKMDQLRIK